MNNDTMQCEMQWIFLICTKIKSILKTKKKIIANFLKKQMFLKQKTLIHFYMNLRCEQDCNATWI
jgi:hypothetical protein